MIGHVKTSVKLKFAFLLILLTWISTTSFAITRYFTPNGSGNLSGTSWINSNRGDSLQSVINSSAVGDEVWVAAGTYRTTTGINRTISFSMRNGVAIYGSFSGNETLLSQRITTNGLTSILSAEIGIPGIADNSYHTIQNTGLNNTAVIDGFIIRDANDNRVATTTNGLGGGIYNNGSGAGNVCSPTIRNCVIINNQAVFGAGIFNSGYLGGVSNPLIINCVIAFNTATSGGGGMDNFALSGTASPTITNCVFYFNTAIQRAGAMYCWGGNNGNANPVVLNTAFVNNTAADGGAIVSDRLNSGGGSSGNSNPNFRNCVFWVNTVSGTGPQFLILGGATFSATYTDINLTGQNPPHTISGATTGNFNANPLFTNISLGAGADNSWLTNDDGLQLQNSSPCINAGSNSGVPLTDILNNNRINNSTVDMGAYEYTPISSVLLNIKMYIQGFYTGPGSMLAVAEPITNPNLCDTITVELHYTLAPYGLAHTVTNTIDINGNGQFVFPPSILNQSFYIALKHRNCIETWSKNPLLFNNVVKSFDFTAP